MFKRLFVLCLSFLSSFSMAVAAVDEPTFLKLIDEFVERNEERVASAGGKLKMVARYDVDMWVAAARRSETEWIIDMWGGFPRLPLMTDDALQLLLCHELGHHMGGEPLKKKSSSKWASVEGQADDFAARDCVKDLWGSLPSKSPASSSDYVKNLCEQKWGFETTEALICERTIIAGYEFLNASLILDNSVAPTYEVEDTSVVDEVLESHPTNQCRLETYKRAALDMPRPTCWYFGDNP